MVSELKRIFRVNLIPAFPLAVTKPSVDTPTRPPLFNVFSKFRSKTLAKLKPKLNVSLQ